MNPRQRRGILLLLATGLGAVLVFVALFLYTSGISSQVGPTTTAVRLTTNARALEPITEDMIETTEIPVRWLSDATYTSPDQLLGLVATGDFDAGVVLQQGMLREPPGLQPGYREVAIMVDAETGVAGKVSPGDRVDILATTVDPETEIGRAEVWVPNALVIEVGIPQAVENETEDGGFTSGEGVPVTFALSGPDALRLAYAESFAVKLRLALRGIGDLGEIPEGERTYDGTMPVPSGSLPAGVIPDGAAASEPEPAPAPAPEPPPAPEPEPEPEAPAEAPAPPQPADEPADEAPADATTEGQ